MLEIFFSDKYFPMQNYEADIRHERQISFKMSGIFIFYDNNNIKNLLTDEFKK